MKLITQRDAEEIVKSGAKEFYYNRTIQLTPGARDIFSSALVKLVYSESASAPSSATSTSAPAAPAPTSSPLAPQPTAQALQIFNSPEAKILKEQICDIGRRMWQREYVDGNGGNISARLGDSFFLCTPTGVSKGFLTPDMLCLVDQDGNQLAGTSKRTSEFMTHLAIYRSTPAAQAVCHGHPVHATAFAAVGVEPPPRLIPEIEVFVGQVALAPYHTPGSPEVADSITPLAPNHQSILMGNHGLITWGNSVEDAYFKMEITDAYCRTVWIATSLPNKGTTIPCDKMTDLLNLKRNMGLPDSRYDLPPTQLCLLDPWADFQCQRPSTQPSANATPDFSKTSQAELEILVQQITDEIMASLETENR